MLLPRPVADRLAKHIYYQERMIESQRAKMAKMAIVQETGPQPDLTKFDWLHEEQMFAHAARACAEVDNKVIVISSDDDRDTADVKSVKRTERSTQANTPTPVSRECCLARGLWSDDEL